MTDERKEALEKVWGELKLSGTFFPQKPICHTKIHIFIYSLL